MTERLPQIHNSDREESRQCYTQPGKEPRPELFDFGNLSPESQAIYDASRAGSRFDHLIDHALLLARIRGDKEQLVYASEPDDTLPGTTLLDAVENGRWNEARGLIRSHVDVNVTNAFGQTALHLADDPGVIDALLRFGAKQDIVDDYGNTPIQAARERNDAASVLIMERHHELVAARHLSVFKPLSL
ncbi:ankyrin repeat domain-containing protein [Stenotrophomonas sp.]|uniref:ankyrin repeat domain-containing protein n=1 Tax=Stenotrophomonas sp. TaxID=69392 RepID=UPI0025D14639|nr:ankyrin repeat domain-containing protein [Stenotrophomonas sp.]MBW8374981.1 hypothetical protein [Stenotrophomonas sp.]